jgi:hypothetical protein
MALAGCNGTIHRKTQLGQDTILAVDARQRLVVEGKHPVSGQRIYCAEPSPDAIVAQAASLASALEAPGAAQGQPIKAALAAGVAESAASIGLRTQTIQLMRDGYYRLCEALVNGQIGPEEYRDIVSNIDGFILTMMAIEQLGDKAFAAPNVAISASNNSGANISGQANSGGGAPSNQGGVPAAGAFGNPVEAAITINNQNGEIARAKSEGIVKVVAIYFKAKEQIHRARRDERIDPNLRYADLYYASLRRAVEPKVIRYDAH